MGIHRYNNKEYGFAFLPVLIIVAVVALLGGSGATIYQVQKNNEAETSALRQELQEIQKEKEEVEQPTESEEEQLEPTPSESPTELSEPEVKAAITKAPTVTTKAPQAVSNETNIPLIVEEEFTKAYGRKPTAGESTEWKNKFRSNNWSRTELYNAIVAAKPTSEPTAMQGSGSSQINTKSSAVSIELCKANAKAEADKILNAALVKSPMLLELTASTKIRDIEQAALKYGIISQSEVPDIQAAYYGLKDKGYSTQEAQFITQTTLAEYNSWLGDIQDNAQAQLNALRATRDKAEEQLYAKCLNNL